jgi:putative heme-binding domain-containing protein
MRAFSPSQLSRAIWASRFSAFAVALLGLSSTSFAQLRATPIEAIRKPEGFEVELLYEVPMDQQGSWVCLCVDPKGRLITSDQYGKLYRVTLNQNAQTENKVQVEQLDVNIGMAQGLLCFADSLYIHVNGQAPDGPGLYQLKDTNGDDQYDSIKMLVPTKGGGEHGQHAIIPGPDGKLYFCAGNQTDIPAKIDRSIVPRNWSEDHLVGRMPDARGFMKDRLAPGGFVARMNPDGSNVELIATGFRNEYDIAFNPLGELMTYDADMEWDVGTPWYRPTRVNHVISGAEFGWRNGTGKWPEYYADSFGAVANIGPGSPTGITFGTGAKFPAKYQQSLLISDWSYGVIYAVKMQPVGATYQGTAEPFISASPLPVTDLVVHPDGNLYFAIGGRKTQSALYRVRYTGTESTAAAQPLDTPEAAKARELRHQLEKYHGYQDPAAIKLALANIGSDDRAIRFAARIALEHQPVDQWRSEVLAQKTPQAIITGIVALTRCGQKSDQAAALQALRQLNWNELTETQKLELLRAYGLCFTRFGTPDDAARKLVVDHLDSHFPSTVNLLNRELAALLVYVKAPNIISRVVKQLRTASAQDDQIHYAFCLREATEGWTLEDRESYLKWFFDVASARGGASFGGFIANIRTVALSHLPEDQKAALAKWIDRLPEPVDPLADLKPRALVKEWKVDDLADVAEKDQQTRSFEKGREMFAVAQCYKCHRFAGQGGIQGPDLTGAGGRFSNRDLLVSIIEPSKEISDQYQSMQFLLHDDTVVVGRVANMNANGLSVMTNMLDPGNFTNIQRKDIAEMKPSPLSPMPSGLIDTLTQEEVLDLIAYIRSGGRPDHPLFGKKTAAK